MAQPDAGFSFPVCSARQRGLGQTYAAPLTTQRRTIAAASAARAVKLLGAQQPIEVCVFPGDGAHVLGVGAFAAQELRWV